MVLRLGRCWGWSIIQPSRLQCLHLNLSLGSVWPKNTALWELNLEGDAIYLNPSAIPSKTWRIKIDPFEHCILKKTKKHTKKPLLPGEYKFNSNGSSGFNISRIGGYWANRFYGLHKSLALRHRGMRDGGELFPIVYQEDKTPSSRSSEWFQLWEQSVLRTNVSNLAIRLYHPNKLRTCLYIICIIYPRRWMPSDKEILTI